jgi:hypothetical protein
MSRYFTLRAVISLWALLFLYSASLEVFASGYNSEHQESRSYSYKQQKVEEEMLLEPIVIRVTGYSAYEKTEDMTSEPKRLMALRASKLDAYRALAERIYGTGISGASTVQDFVLKHDGFGTVVDSVVRGARVVSVSEKKGAGFETVLELLLPGNFQDCLNKTNSFRYGSNCLRPVTQNNTYRSDSAMTTQSNSRAKKGNNAMDSIYYLQ